MKKEMIISLILLEKSIPRISLEPLYMKQSPMGHVILSVPHTHERGL